MSWTQESLKELVRRDLPRLMRQDAEFRAFVLELLRHEDPAGAEERERYWASLDEAAPAQEDRPAGPRATDSGALSPDQGKGQAPPGGKR